MIIKGVFRRYQKWNPVHPTSGAFWGMGVGLGCGVGWGPGFGPEVVGYVGAGCGVGFSVGITFAGFGIGLPANILINGPYKAAAVSANYAWDVVRSNGLFKLRDDYGDELRSNIPLFPSHFGNLQQKANEGFSLCTKSISESLRSFRNRSSGKDDK